VSSSKTTFVLLRAIAAPIGHVFAAWTDARRLAEWLSTSAESDPREGGRFRLESESSDGVHVVEGIYRELIPNRRLVLTWEYRAPGAAEAESETLVSVELREIDATTTELSLHEEQIRGPALEEDVELAAWGGAFDRLATLVA
jgi:uncharacterized protein YndB with AHSA1/START domain